jgi:hypothetical protein
MTPQPSPAGSAAFFATCAGAGASAHVLGTGVASLCPRAFLTFAWRSASKARSGETASRRPD